MHYINLPQRNILVSAIESFDFDDGTSQDGDIEDGEPVTNPAIGTPKLTLQLISGQQVVIEGNRSVTIFDQLDSILTQISSD